MDTEQKQDGAAEGPDAAPGNGDAPAKARVYPVAIVAAILTAYIALAFWPVKDMRLPAAWKAKADGAPLVIAHQGGAMERPSESNLAFEHAATLGVDVFELDVALTADGVLAVIHDLTLDRTTDGSGPVRARTYAEVRFLDAGYGLLGTDGRPIRDPAANPYIGVGAYVPSLEELFRAYPDMPMLVELKDGGDDGALAAREFRRLVDAYGRADRTIVASFHKETMKAFGRLPGDPVVAAASEPEAARYVVLQLLGFNALNNDLRFKTMCLPTSGKAGPITLDTTREPLRKDFAARGGAIYYWTINERSEMERLVNLGVDGIITDRPSELLAVAARARP